MYELKQKIKITPIKKNPPIPDIPASVIEDVSLSNHISNQTNLNTFDVYPPFRRREMIRAWNPNLLCRLMALDNFNVLISLKSKTNVKLYKKIFEAINSESSFEIKHKFSSAPIQIPDFSDRLSHFLYDKDFEVAYPIETKQIMYRSNMVGFLSSRYQDTTSINLDMLENTLFFFKIHTEYSEFSQYHLVLKFLSRMFSLHTEIGSEDAIFKASVKVVDQKPKLTETNYV